jgi:hypothetical protein
MQLKGLLVVLGLPALLAGCASAALFAFPIDQGDIAAGFLDSKYRVLVEDYE